MELEVEAQENLGAIVQTCLESIEDGSNTGRLSNISKNSDVLDSSKDDGEKFNPLKQLSMGSLMSTETENQNKQQKELQKQMILIEEEARVLRDKNAKLNADC